jgi:hypothetical protein
MSMRPVGLPEVPEQTVMLGAVVVGHGIADHRERLNTSAISPRPRPDSGISTPLRPDNHVSEITGRLHLPDCTSKRAGRRPGTQT